MVEAPFCVRFEGCCCWSIFEIESVYFYRRAVQGAPNTSISLPMRSLGFALLPHDLSAVTFLHLTAIYFVSVWVCELRVGTSSGEDLWRRNMGDHQVSMLLQYPRFFGGNPRELVLTLYFILLYSLLTRKQAEVDMDGHFLLREIYEDEVTYNLIGAAVNLLSK